MVERQLKMLGKAFALSADKHMKQFDKAGKPYFMHPLQVMLNLGEEDPELQQIALLHDIVEDTDITYIDLRRMGFSDRVLAAIYLLTKNKSTPYDYYIEQISTNIDAVKVKLADLQHNMDISRLKEFTEKDKERLDKYYNSHVILIEVLEKYNASNDS